MKKDQFRLNFQKSIDIAYNLAIAHVAQTLPHSFRFYIYPNSSNDGVVPLRQGEATYPDDSPTGYECYGPHNFDDVVKFLWRGETVPEWINISVVLEDTRHTYFNLLVCGRFTKAETLLYHQKEGYSPFHALSPILPPGFATKPGPTEKFDLYWFKRRSLLGKILRAKPKLNSTSLSH